MTTIAETIIQNLLTCRDLDIKRRFWRDPKMAGNCFQVTRECTVQVFRSGKQARKTNVDWTSPFPSERGRNLRETSAVMRAQAIEIAWHEGTSVWSVSCSTNGRRLVTGGNDKIARVWRLVEDVYNAVAPRRKNPEILPQGSDKSIVVNTVEQAPAVEWLCDLSGHAATVNVARFSKQGDFIASGADQGELILWKKEEGVAAGSDKGTGPPDAASERWTQLCILRGHSADVLDVCWNYDGKKLASASVDNSIRVWDVANPRRPLAVISFHDSIVQGVAFDPTGRFLASLGNDRALAVHSTSGFRLSGKCVMTVGEQKAHYFASDVSCHSVFRRLAWSPDGSFLACPSGLQIPATPKPHLFSLHLFARGLWTNPVLQCSGLKKLPIAVAFCPQLFSFRRAEMESPQDPHFALPYRMIFAVACFDAVLLYDTESFGRPFARVEGIHYAELTDVSWCPDGSALLVSSTDGSVSIIALSEEELGSPLPAAQWPKWMASDKPTSTSGASVLEPVTPLTVIPRSKHSLHQAPPALPQSVQHPIISEKDGVREITMVVPRRRQPEDAAERNDCVAVNDPARKRLKL